MKKLTCLCLICSMLLSLCIAVSAKGFDDTKGHWAEKSIERWSDLGLINGKGGGKFDPNGLMTRAEAAAIFSRLLNLQGEADISKFSDIATGAWYVDSLKKCVAAGILNGDNGKMNPNGYITREMFFTMLVRALSISPESTLNKNFTDKDQISSWARENTYALINNGYVNGVTATEIRPKDNINRASVVTLIDRLISVYATEDGTLIGNSGNGIALILSNNCTVGADFNGTVIVAAPDVSVFFDLAHEIKVIVKANNVKLTSVPRNTYVVVIKEAEGTNVNGNEVNPGDNYLVDDDNKDGTTFNAYFNADGGKVGIDKISVTKGEPYGTLPIPTKEGYEFIGWFIRSSDGEEAVTEDTVFSGNDSIVLYARWIANSYTVYFDANDGSVNTDAKTVTYGKTYGTLPVPTRDGCKFLGWFTAKENGDQVTAEKIFQKTYDVVLYAQWSENKYTVYFDANKGEVGTHSKSVTYNKAYGTLPVPTHDGYTFVGWFTSPDSGEEVTSDVIFKEDRDIVLYARWAEKPYTVHFDARGGKASADSKAVVVGSAYGVLPVATREGYAFLGWFTEADGGVQITKNNIFDSNDDVVLYAHWELDDFTVTFNANGGRADKTSVKVSAGTAIGELPGATRAGFEFIGWFDENGEQISERTKFSEDETVKARWLSDFVEADEMPSGSEKESEKWTYDLTETKTSDEDHLDGYTLFNTTYEWGEWSAFSTKKVTASDTREVDTKTVTDKEGYTEYAYSRYVNQKQVGSYAAWSVGHYCLTCACNYHGVSSSYWKQDWLSWGTQGWSTTRLEKDIDWGCGCGKTGYRYYYNGVYWYEEHSRNIPAVTHDEYRYRDKIFTYHHKRIIPKESNTLVVESDTISNIKHYVRYIVK